MGIDPSPHTSAVSVRVPVWEFTWINPLFGEPVSVVFDGVWLICPLLPVNHQVIEVEDSARAVVMPVVFGVGSV